MGRIDAARRLEVVSEPEGNLRASEGVRMKRDSCLLALTSCLFLSPPLGGEEKPTAGALSVFVAAAQVEAR